MADHSFKKRGLILALAALGLTALFLFTPAGRLLNIPLLLDNKSALLETVNRHYLPSVLIFIALYIFVVALSIPGATVVTLSGGFLFGPILSVLYINIGATIGAALIFTAARYFLGEMLQKKYSVQLEKFNRDFEENGRNYMLSLRLIPVFPFFLVNLLSGLTTIPLRTFLWTTSLGIIPGSFAYAYLGYAGSTLEAGDGIPPRLILAFAFLGLLALLPVLRKRWLKRE